jgi:hypothetical protein
MIGVRLCPASFSKAVGPEDGPWERYMERSPQGARHATGI